MSTLSAISVILQCMQRELPQQLLHHWMWSNNFLSLISLIITPFWLYISSLNIQLHSSIFSIYIYPFNHWENDVGFVTKHKVMKRLVDTETVVNFIFFLSKIYFTLSSIISQYFYFFLKSFVFVIFEERSSDLYQVENTSQKYAC